MKMRIMSNLEKIVLVCAILICSSLMICLYFAVSPSSNVVVNGNSTEGVTYYLGDRMYAEGGNYFYFHGITSPNTPNLDELLIAHSVGGGGSSNIHIRLVRGDTFRIKSQSFKIINYGDSWITLEEV